MEGTHRHGPQGSCGHGHGHREGSGETQGHRHAEAGCCDHGEARECCGHGEGEGGFRRRFRSRDERLAQLEQYRKNSTVTSSYATFRFRSF